MPRAGTDLMEVVFWVSLFSVAYPYAIYPALLVGWNRLAGRRPLVPDLAHRPSVSVVLPVHNEARRIEAKVKNLLELNYLADRVQIIVVGDGCTDDTLERAVRAGGSRVSVCPLANRAGKAAALNAGLAQATSEIVVFTDAGILLDRARSQVSSATSANRCRPRLRRGLVRAAVPRGYTVAQNCYCAGKKHACTRSRGPAVAFTACDAPFAGHFDPAWRLTSSRYWTPCAQATAPCANPRRAAS